MTEARDAAVRRARELVDGAASPAPLDEIDELRARFPNDPELRLWCDVAEVRLGAPDRAWALLAEAARAHGERPHVWTRQHLVRLLRAAPDRVVERLEATLADGDPELATAAGEGFGQEGRLELALRWFDRVLERDPSHLRARTLRTWTRWLLTVDPASEEEMRALAAEHPEDETVAELLREMSG